MQRLREAADIKRVEATVVDQSGNGCLGIFVVATDRHRWTHFVARVRWVFKVLEAVHGKCFDDTCVRGCALHYCAAGSLTCERVDESRTDGVRAVHEYLPAEEACHGPKRILDDVEWRRKKRHVRTCHRVGDGLGREPRVPGDRLPDTLGSRPHLADSHGVSGTCKARRKWCTNLPRADERNAQGVCHVCGTLHEAWQRLPCHAQNNCGGGTGHATPKRPWSLSDRPIGWTPIANSAYTSPMEFSKRGRARQTGDWRRPPTVPGGGRVVVSDLSASEPVLDALGEALHLLRMTGSTYVRSDMTAPWAIPLGPLPAHVSFHLVVDGRCVIDVAGHGHLVLETGDLALVPRGVAHRLASDANITVGATDVHVGRHRVTERYVVQAGGGGGDLTTLVCGAVQFDHPLGRQLIDALPPLVRIEARHDPEAGWRLAAARQVAVEVRQARPGGAFVITRLADLLVIHGIRAWLARDPASGDGWLGALRDPQIGRALTLLHRDPTREWTVASLASEVSMSRSSFAARFARMVGEAPMRYLARWRMELAASRLRDGTEVVGDVARRVGYRSEAAFSRAHKRIVGHPPGAVRLDAPVRRPPTQ